MIRTNALLGTHTPKHKATGPRVKTGHDFRDYPEYVCPGTHCAGLSEPAAHGHRHTVQAVHMSADSIRMVCPVTTCRVSAWGGLPGDRCPGCNNVGLHPVTR